MAYSVDRAAVSRIVQYRSVIPMMCWQGKQSVSDAPRSSLSRGKG